MYVHATHGTRVWPTKPMCTYIPISMFYIQDTRRSPSRLTPGPGPTNMYTHVYSHMWYILCMLFPSVKNASSRMKVYTYCCWT